MKLFAVIFCLVISVSAFGQKADTIHKQDTSVNGKIRCLGLLSSLTRPVIIVDGIQMPFDSLKNIDPASIVSINILKRISGKDIYNKQPDNGAMIFVTKQSAIKIYQKKLSALSKKYKAYLENTKPKDQNILYVLNGVPVNDYSTDGMKTLYDIPFKRIRKVTFLKGVDTPEIYDSRPVPILVITTKK